MLYAQVREAPWTVRVGMQAAGGSSDDLPFWLRANQYGTMDSTSANAILRTRLTRRVNLNSDFHLAFGAEVLARASDHPTLFAHELYGQANYRNLRLQVGRWEEEPTGLLHPTLSIGSMGRSRNAPPVPKIALWSPSYIPIPGVEKTLAVRGYLAHGWFPNSRFVRNALLHEKYLYIRVFSRDLPIQLHGGILQHTIWGGTHPRRGALPQDLDTFLRVLVGQPGGSNAPQTDQGGGTIGSTEAGYDFGITAQVGDWEAHVSRYFHHTDQPSLRFRNPWDGVWEARIERAPNRRISTVLWGHLNATRHNARYSEGEERGEDTYYNNSLYRGGWVHRGFTLGSPFLLPNSSAPGIANNIVLAHHLGLAGQIAPTWRYRLLLTYSRHYGAQHVCADASCTQRVDRRTDRTDQYSTRVEVAKRWGSLTLRTALATDLGALYSDRLGAWVGLSWRSPLAAIR
jgi:hypothetical protein